MDELVQFRWKRALGHGYTWQTLDIREGLLGEKVRAQRVLTYPASFGTETFGASNKQKPGVPVIEETQPLKNQTLFCDFANVEFSEESITLFANRHGLLVGNHFGAQNNKGPAFNGDPYSLWEKEIAEARIARDLWNAVLRENLEVLGQWIKWSNKGGTVKFDYNHNKNERITTIASSSHHPETYKLFEPNDVVLPARIMLARIINERLYQHAAPQMYWSRTSNKSGLYLSPKNLLGAMWLQFAQAVDERKLTVRCENCGTWFAPTRKDARYCSDKCRVIFNRKQEKG